MNIYPYKMGSQSATDLAHNLGVKQIRHEGSKFKGSADKLVINWGASQVPAEVAKCKVINKPEAVSKAADKLASFRAMHEAGVSIPDFTMDMRVADNWGGEGYTVLARTKLNGHSGEGIVIVEPGQPLPAAPLYVKYVPKKEEYRVHVMAGQVMFVQRKARRKDVADDKVNWKVRNHDNGFIFAANEGLGEVPDDTSLEAIKAVQALGLDFGAVDVIHNAKHNKSYVLEVNTAPGLAGESAAKYAQWISANWGAAKKAQLDKVPMPFEDWIVQAKVQAALQPKRI